jgi:hypothetical protein
MHDAYRVPENEQAMNNSISRSSKSRVHRPHGVTPVRLMNRTAAIYEVCASRPIARPLRFDDRKKESAEHLGLCSEVTGQALLFVDFKQ